MARKHSTGFEWQAISGVEWGVHTTNGTVSTATKRSGAAALRVNSPNMSQGKGMNLTHTSSTGPWYYSAYLYVVARPSADNTIMGAVSTGTTNIGMIKLAADGSLKLFESGTQIGSASAVLDLNTWYRVELKYDYSQAGGSDIIQARLNGVEFAGATDRSLTTAVQKLALGMNLAAEAQNTGDWYWDDVTINDATGSFENSWHATDYHIGHLFPVGAGDNSDWTNAYTEVDEVTPDDATTLCASNTLNAVDYHTVSACSTIGMDSDDTVNCIQVRLRFNGVGALASANPDVVVGVKATSGGTIEESSALLIASASWLTDAVASPRIPPLTLYDLPGASTTAWTPATLDTMQIGYRVSVVGSSSNGQITAINVAVDWTPVTGGAPATTTRRTLSALGTRAGSRQMHDN